MSELGFAESHAAGVFVFLGECGVEHGRIVGGEHDGNAVAIEPRQGMIFDEWERMVQLQGERSRPDVACGADFQRDTAIGKEIHECRIVDGSNAVADALHAQEFDGFTNFLGATYFARMD